MAKRSIFFEFNKQVANDFNPDAVYEGISEIDYELEDMEESPPYDDDDLDNLNEEIEFFLDNNK